MRAAPTVGEQAGLDRRRLVAGLAGLSSSFAWPRSASASSKPAAKDAASAHPVTYHRTATVDGIRIFYRELADPTHRVITRETVSFTLPDPKQLR